MPEWLDTYSSKVKIIDHREIIDDKYLPVFNSSVIEMNIDKIPGLSEKFVYFNDDMLLNRPLSPEDFFQGDQPCDYRIYKPIVPFEEFDHILINNGILLNRYLDSKWPLSKRGIFSKKYGSDLFRNLLMMPYLKRSGVPGYVEPHGPLSLKKSSFALARQIWPKEIAENNTHRFREYNDVTVWLVRHLQLERGEFCPRGCHVYSLFALKFKLMKLSKRWKANGMGQSASMMTWWMTMKLVLVKLTSILKRSFQRSPVLKSKMY